MHSSFENSYSRSIEEKVKKDTDSLHCILPVQVPYAPGKPRVNVGTALVELSEIPLCGVAVCLIVRTSPVTPGNILPNFDLLFKNSPPCSPSHAKRRTMGEFKTLQ
jgi:hypothetical protein